MMEVQISEQERSLFRAGGIAAILGSIIFLIVFVIVGVFVGPDPLELETFVTQFPAIRTARIFENSLYLLVLILWVLPAAALYYALKAKNLAAALFGAIVAISGLVIMAASALPHIATTPLSNLYHAAEATAETRASISLMWQASWAVFEAILIAGLACMPIAEISLGIAMLKSPDFGRSNGFFAIILGILGLVGIGISMVDVNAPSAAIVVFGLIIFHFVMGWKLYKLGKTS